MELLVLLIVAALIVGGVALYRRPRRASTDFALTRDAAGTCTLLATFLWFLFDPGPP